MAIPTFVAAGTNNTGTGIVTGGMPAGATTDDILIYRIESWGGDAAPGVTAGWTLVGTRITDNLAIDDARVTVWWAPYSAGISRAVADTGNHTNVRITAWRGCDTTNPIHVSTTDAEVTNVTSHTFVGPTTTVDECKIVCVVAFGDDSNASLASGPTNPNLTSIGQDTFSAVASGNDGAGFVCWGDLATAGDSGTWTMGVTTAERSAAVIFALKPPAGGGGGATHPGWRNAFGGGWF